MSIHKINNDILSIAVKPTGAELSSLKNLNTGIEHLWQGNSEFWTGQAPNLFPVIGLLKDGEFTYEGKAYQMPKHGFVRHNENIKLKEETAHKLVFELEFSEETLKIYPFKFRFQISYTLNQNKLEVAHKLVNLDEKSLYFSLGGHPAFNAPISSNEAYEDYYLEFDQKLDLRTHLLDQNGLVSTKTEGVLDNQDKIKLHKNLFDNDALIFKNIQSKKVSLKSQNSGEILNVEYSNFKNLGIWAKPGAPYVCIEPWLGIADLADTNKDFTTKEGIEKLESNTDFTAVYTITINT